MEIDNFIIIVKESEKKAVMIQKKSASQYKHIRKPPVSVALCSLPLSFRSQYFLAGSLNRNVRLLCASLCWAAGV